MLENTEWKRAIRIGLVWWGIVGLLLFLRVSDENFFVALGSAALLVTFCMAPMALLRPLGMLSAQAQLVIDADGARYGDTLVPASSIVGCRLRRRLGHRAVCFRVEGFRPSNPIQRFEIWWGAPISQLNRNWSENADFVDAVRQHLPDVRLPPTG